MPWHSMLFVICFFSWGSSIRLTSFWGCYLEFLSIITASANWRTMFDLSIPTWLLLHSKLSSYLILWKIGFLVTVLLWRTYHAEVLFLDLHVDFALVYFSFTDVAIVLVVSKNAYPIQWNIFSFYREACPEEK